MTARKSVNDTLQKTYTYTYDTYGNIRTATDGTTSHTYTYGDSNWADLLTAYDGTALTYDASGNPTSYYNGSSYTMQWRNGRELQDLTKGGKKTSYEYDVDGLRNLKTNADGSYSVYYWLGNLLLAEERHTGNSTRVLVFSYDESNSPVGFQFKTNDGPWYYYLYAKNIQGDIIALYRRDIDSNGNKVATHIANYEYDPWGKIISIKNAAGQDLSIYPDNSANINPLRYRGYYYDNESGFYYLQSRYYDPSIGRFINADIYASTGQSFIGYNMFAYCNNNPVCFSDDSGTLCTHSTMMADGGGGRNYEPQHRDAGNAFVAEGMISDSDLHGNVTSVTCVKEDDCYSPSFWGDVQRAVIDNILIGFTSYSASKAIGSLGSTIGKIGSHVVPMLIDSIVIICDVASSASKFVYGYKYPKYKITISGYYQQNIFGVGMQKVYYTHTVVVAKKAVEGNPTEYRRLVDEWLYW